LTHIEKLFDVRSTPFSFLNESTCSAIYS
jgi:hypothetical protein